MLGDAWGCLGMLRFLGSFLSKVRFFGSFLSKVGFVGTVWFIGEPFGFVGTVWFIGEPFGFIRGCDWLTIDSSLNESLTNLSQKLHSYIFYERSRLERPRRHRKRVEGSLNGTRRAPINKKN